MTRTSEAPSERSFEVLFEAMHHGQYSFDDFLHAPVQDLSSRVEWRKRTIYRPTKKLRAFHNFLNVFVLQYLPVNQRICFSYRKGVTLRNAVEVHSRSRAFFQTDLAKFFDSITVEIVRKAVAAASTPVVDLPMFLDRIAELTTVDGKLAIGFSTSPLISNSSLKAFDDAFEAECDSRGLSYSRYADDLIVSGQDLNALDAMEGRISRLLVETVGSTFRINPQKSRVIRVGRKVNILGLSILPSGRVSVARELRVKVETQLHFYLTDRARFSEIHKGETEDGIQRLSGYIGHIHSVDPLYIEKLRRKFGVTVIDSFLHRSAQ